jgi:glycosyltransferase involved in cell wall biosynthesis
MKCIYVAGPYNPQNGRTIEENRSAAAEVAAVIRSRGMAAIVPHLESHLGEEVLTECGWLAHGFELMRRCDAVALAPGWRESFGAGLEVSLAKDLGMPLVVAYVGDWVETLKHEIDARDNAPSNCIPTDTALGHICAALGWQGGTIHQAVTEIKKLLAGGIKTE